MLCDVTYPQSHRRQLGHRVVILREETLGSQAICPMSQGQDGGEK